MKPGRGSYVHYSSLSEREIYLLNNIMITGIKDLGYRTSRLLKGKEGKREKNNTCI